MLIHLVRHGETAFNARRIVQGPVHDEPLSDVGRAQARAVGARFSDTPIAAIYASPLKRARETADEIATVTGASVTAVPEFAEFHWGALCGKPQMGIDGDAMSGFVARWADGDFDATPPGGESPSTVADRVRRAWAQILSRHPPAMGMVPTGPSDVVIVAHGRLNKILLAGIVAGDLRRMESFPQSNTGVTLLESSGDQTAGWKVTTLDDTAHLDFAGLTSTADRPPERA